MACELGDRALNDGNEPLAREWFEQATAFDSNNEVAKRRLQRLAKAWQKPDSIIVNEPYWTSTAKFADVVLPVAKWKWLEPRHMINVENRWSRDRNNDLQYCFFNGVGYNAWENVWGIWNGLTPRDAETLRRVATVQRALAPLRLLGLDADIVDVAPLALTNAISKGVEREAEARAAAGAR